MYKTKERLTTRGRINREGNPFKGIWSEMRQRKKKKKKECSELQREEEENENEVFLCGYNKRFAVFTVKTCSLCLSWPSPLFCFVISLFSIIIFIFRTMSN